MSMNNNGKDSKDNADEQVAAAPQEAEMEFSEQNFEELKKLAKVSAEALVEESNRRAEIEKELDRLQSRADELQDNTLRLQAEFDNFRKRKQGEIDSLFTDGMAEAIKLMLPIIDDLGRAVDAANEVDENMGKGISMCINQFMDTFGKKGLEEIAAEGQEFDPNLHEAILQQPCEEDEQSGKVAEVMQKGYIFKDKVLRYSVVKVYE